MGTGNLTTMDNITDNFTNSDNTTESYQPSLETEAVIIIKTILLPMICSLGIAGTVLTLIVLSRKNMRTSTNCYLTALSVADLLFLVILATSLLQGEFVPYSTEFYHFIIYITYAAVFMQVFLLASIWITVILAVERFIAICKPFLAATMCTLTKARIIICVIFALALITRLSHFWEDQATKVFNTETNTSFFYITGTELSTNEQYIKWQPWIIDVVISSLLPFILLVVLNTRLIWEVRKSTKYLQSNQMLSGSSSAAQREEIQVSIMLISVIVVFLLCQLPYVLYTAVQSLVNKYDRQPHIILFRFVTILLLALKSAINFLLYCGFSEKFRAALKKALHLDVCLRRLKGEGMHPPSISAFSTKETDL